MRSLQEIEAEIAAVRSAIGKRPSRDPSRRIQWTEDALRRAKERELNHRERAAWHEARHHRWRMWWPAAAERHKDAWKAHEALQRAEQARIERHQGELEALRERQERYRKWDAAAKPHRARLEELRNERTERLTAIHSQAVSELQDAGLSQAEIREAAGDRARRLAAMERCHGQLVDDPDARAEAERREAERRARWRPWERRETEDDTVHM